MSELLEILGEQWTMKCPDIKGVPAWWYLMDSAEHIFSLADDGFWYAVYKGAYDTRWYIRIEPFEMSNILLDTRPGVVPAAQQDVASLPVRNFETKEDAMNWVNAIQLP